MNAIAEVLDKPIFQALGWTLIHFIWQGALIGILYCGLSLILRRRSANVRYAAACISMLLMLAAPSATLITIRTSAVVPSSGAVTEWATVEVEPVAVKSIPAVSTVNNAVQADRASGSEALVKWMRDGLPQCIPWLLALWFAGVLFLSLRFAGGLMIVHRLKRVETGPNTRIWQESKPASVRLARLS